VGKVRKWRNKGGYAWAHTGQRRERIHTIFKNDNWLSWTLFLTVLIVQIMATDLRLLR